MRAEQILQELPKADHVVRVIGTGGLVTLLGKIIRGFDAVSLQNGNLIIADVDRGMFASLSHRDLQMHYVNFFGTGNFGEGLPPKIAEVLECMSIADLKNITAEQSLLCISSGGDLRMCIYRRADCLEQGKLGDVLKTLSTRVCVLIARSLLSKPNENTIEVVTKHDSQTSLAKVDISCISPNVDDEVSYKEVYATDSDGVTYLFRSVSEYQKPE